MTTWQPMASAPRTGDRILLRCPFGGYTHHVRCARWIKRDQGDCWRTDSGDYVLDRPEHVTHWMDLPSTDLP